MKQAKVLLTSATEPIANIATEEWLFEGGMVVGAAMHTLYLWRNKPTVVIGAHQNALRECALNAMERDGVALARRRTGGGAVFHDLGNTNFTFISHTPHQHPSSKTAAVDVMRNTAVVTRALARFGLHAEASGRNDITVGGRKVSGSAFRRGTVAALHHGTLLINTDLAALSRYLTPNKLKLQAKGVTSTRARVANLAELAGPGAISHEKLCEALADEFAREFVRDSTAAAVAAAADVAVIEPIDIARLRADAKFCALDAALRSWDWRVGADPAFATRFETRRDWGMVDLRFKVDGGRIADVAFFTDSLVPAVVSTVCKCLRSVKFRRSNVIAALSVAASASASTDGELRRQILDLSSWLAPQLVA